jgi:hypothetical protein
MDEEKFDEETKEYVISCCEEARKIFHKMLHKKLVRKGGKDASDILLVSKALAVLGQHTVDGIMKGKEKDTQEVADAKEIYEANEDAMQFIEDFLGDKVDFAVDEAHWNYEYSKFKNPTNQEEELKE